MLSTSPLLCPKATISTLMKVIGGFRMVVFWDQHCSADTLAEPELAFYAQDKDDNVRYIGENRSTRTARVYMLTRY